MTENDLTERQSAILEMVERRGYVTVEGLADAFGVSAQTVRRDIIAMDAAGLLQRFHGGAGSARQAQALRLGHGRKLAIAADSKRRIAEEAARLVPAGAVVYLDVGTTLEAVAAALSALEDLVVFTNSMRAALAIDHNRHAVHVLGGVMAGQDGSLVGEHVALRLSDVRLDLAFIGCSAVDDAGDVLDFDLRKIAIKKVAMASARTAVLCATRDKFGRTARARIAPLGAFHEVLTGDDAPAANGG